MHSSYSQFFIFFPLLLLKNSTTLPMYSDFDLERVPLLDANPGEHIDSIKESYLGKIHLLEDQADPLNRNHSNVSVMEERNKVDRAIVLQRASEILDKSIKKPPKDLEHDSFKQIHIDPSKGAFWRMESHSDLMEVIPEIFLFRATRYVEYGRSARAKTDKIINNPKLPKEFYTIVNKVDKLVEKVTSRYLSFPMIHLQYLNLHSYFCHALQDQFSNDDEIFDLELNPGFVDLSSQV
ncbi:hypothetical protein PGT21_011133 [Puccinia graminis f. sp. tritici]|uniref:Uncharacterized protein n=1 Tax=Puccinia graminis f. sp. tritici TaxID=56615 RepID=A0A5B0PTL1_PUCGR|nr:hypothetical protein PGT21_011133 [Puccinia graminis f. sp. tritici]